MGYQRFHRWLGKLSSSALCVRAETAPDDIINFISVSTAVLALTLEAAKRLISLSFFCSSRRKISPRKQDSGVLGILRSLNGQLLRIMLERQLLVKPPFGQDDKMWSKSTKSIAHSWRLLTKLMELLPPRSVVFVLLDSISCASGDKSLVDELAEKILRFGRRSHSIVVKLLVTDPVPNSHCRRTVDLALHVPDDVDGWKRGMNVKSMKRKNPLKLRDLEVLQESGES